MAGLFGLSQQDVQSGIDDQNQKQALQQALLTRGQMNNYNGALAGQMIGAGIDEAAGNQDPQIEKAQKLQQVQQQTEQQAPWQTDPEAHMKLAVKNLLDAGLQTEAGNAYQSYLEYMKTNTGAMNAKTLQAENQLSAQKRQDELDANKQFQDFITTYKKPPNGASPAPAMTEPSEDSATPPANINQPDMTGVVNGFDLSTPQKRQQAIDQANRIVNPDDKAKVLALLNSTQANPTASPATPSDSPSAPKQFVPPTDPALIDQFMASPSKLAQQWAKQKQAENDKAEQYWHTANDVSANTKFSSNAADVRAENSAQLKITHGASALTPEQNDALFGQNGAVTQGKLDPRKINSRTASLLANAYLLNPNMDMNKLASDSAMMQNATYMNKQYTLETMPEVMKNMVDAGKKLNYSDVKFIGNAEAFAKGQLNDPDFTAYMASRNDALLSIAATMRGVGMSDQAHRAEIEAASPTMSPKALDAWLQAQNLSLAPRLKMANKFTRTTPQSANPTASPAINVPNVNQQGWKLHTDANGNKAYVSPDGKQFQELK